MFLQSPESQLAKYLSEHKVLHRKLQKNETSTCFEYTLF